VNIHSDRDDQSHDQTLQKAHTLICYSENQIHHNQKNDKLKLVNAVLL